MGTVLGEESQSKGVTRYRLPRLPARCEPWRKKSTEVRLSPSTRPPELHSHRTTSLLMPALEVVRHHDGRLVALLRVFITFYSALL